MPLKKRAALSLPKLPGTPVRVNAQRVAKKQNERETTTPAANDESEKQPVADNGEVL